MESPFEEIPKEQWKDKRDELIEEHPLSISDVRNLVLNSFEKLKKTTIGDPNDGIRLFDDVEPSAQVQGDFLEVLMAKTLSEGNQWRHGTEAEKDFIFEPEVRYSTELKSSGQEGKTEVYGNRSYAQRVDENDAKKSKTGYYITVNFYLNKVYLIRFGWLDFSDWTGQESESGQSAHLSNEAYQHKLKIINGDYRLNAPIIVLDDVGGGTRDRIKDTFNFEGIMTVREFIDLYETERRDFHWRVDNAYETAKEYEEEINQG